MVEVQHPLRRDTRCKCISRFSFSLRDFGKAGSPCLSNRLSPLRRYERKAAFRAIATVTRGIPPSFSTRRHDERRSERNAGSGEPPVN